MQLETLKAIEILIEKFGFPIFVAICGLLLFVAVFRYMREALEKKDCDLLQYVEKRDAQIDGIVEKPPGIDSLCLFLVFNSLQL